MQRPDIPYVLWNATSWRSICPLKCVSPEVK